MKLNKDIPADVFMHIAGKEVISLRKRVADLEVEVARLTLENKSLKENAMTTDKYKAHLERERSYKAEIKRLQEDTGMVSARATIKSLKRHNEVIAHRYIEALNKRKEYDIRDIMDLAYTAGFASEKYDFDGYYRGVLEVSPL